jgi:hypothetical protein
MPSKKILGFLVITAGLVTSIIIVLGGEKSDVAISAVNNLVAGDEISIPENPDWQTEISKFSEQELLLEEEGETVTDNISRNLMSNYISLRGNTGLDENSSQALVESTSEYIDTLNNKEINTSVSLNIHPDNGKITIIEYGERLGNVFKYNIPKNPINEVDLIKEAVSENDTQKIEGLSLAIETYRKIERDLLTMPVPKTFEKSHTDIVIGIRGIILGLEEISVVFTDSFRSLNGMKIYQESASLFIQAVKATSQYITNNNVSYKQDSGGYYLIHGI